MKQIPLTQTCPCGSGKPYKGCCAEKTFKWVEDENGNIYRSVPEHPQLEAVRKSSEAQYKRIFGRKFRSNDPIIFENPSAEELTKRTVEMMGMEGVRPEIIYAFQKTGLIVSETNLSLLPDKDLKEWQDAVREFHKQEKANRKNKKESDPLYDLLMKYLKSSVSLEDAIAVLTRIINDHGIARNIQSKEKKHTFNDFIFLCSTKSLKSLQATKILLDYGHGEDALILARTVFENYLKIGFALANPERVNDFVSVKLGLLKGTHVVVTKKENGKKRRVVIDKATNAEFAYRISVKEMAEKSIAPEDIKIYEFLYSYLSDYIHSQFPVIEAYITEAKFDVYKREKMFHGCLYSAFSAALILHALTFFKGFSPEFRKDLNYFLAKISKDLISVLDGMTDEKGSTEFSDAFCNRLRKIILGVKPVRSKRKSL